MAKLAEESGFDSIWVGDTLLLFDLPVGLFECWSVLAATAQATSDISLGSLVSANPFRNPTLTAKIAQTVDNISGGRLTLGLGSGGARRQHTAFGMPQDRRFERLEEALPLVKRLLGGESVTHRGEFYTAEECILLPATDTQGRIPLLLAGISSQIFNLTARYADAWNAWLAYSDSSPNALRPHLGALEAECENVGRPPGDVQKTVGLGVRLDGARLIVGGLDFSEGAIVGDVDGIGEKLNEFADLGVDTVQLTFAPCSMDALETLGGINRWFPRASKPTE